MDSASEAWCGSVKRFLMFFFEYEQRTAVSLKIFKAGEVLVLGAKIVKVAGFGVQNQQTSS